MHGGQSGAVLKAKGEALSAWRAIPGQVAVSPADAVMSMLQVAWLRAELYAGLLHDQLEDAADSEGDGGNGVGGGVGRGEGLIGHTRSASPSVGIYESGEAYRGLTRLEAEERDRTVRYAKAAHDMGIADREIRLAEAQGLMLAQAVSRILDALELTAAQRALVPQVVPGVLRSLETGAGS
jgi:hypothetical protein